MIEDHPRLGFAVLGGVLVALIALGVLFTRDAGSVGTDLSDLANVAPSAADVPSLAPQQPAARKQARSTTVVDPAWVARMSSRAGIPAPAMQAYADAELLVDAEQPGCHLSWNTLAGIGWIESQHGTLGGRALEAGGRSSTPIIGPALDGRQFAAIRSTPSSASWHGDATWEHAVGPLQFLASTWDRWGADGDGDGTADPLDIDDAVLAAGHYLCADGHDLSSVSGWNAAVLSYNHDQAYVLNVLAAANTYAERTAGR